MQDDIVIRPMRDTDGPAVQAIVAPITREGCWWPIPPEFTEEESLRYWLKFGNVFVAEHRGVVVGTYYLKANQPGGGAHVANCGYATRLDHRGGGVGQAMCVHSLAEASGRGFRAMQFNSVLSSNDRAVAIYQRNGFEIVGRLPEAFMHPSLGLIKLYVMYRKL
jgi:ribosomal protein S18 acetylase RimI-like enzyme